MARPAVRRSARNHSLATRLSGAALGRVLGVDRAAQLLGVDRNSIRRWLGDHPADDDWQIIEEMAGAQLVERIATGKVKSARDLAIIKGVAGRNVRAKELIARREAGRSAGCDCVLPPGWIPELHPKPDTPEHERAVWDIAAAKMSPARHMFMQELRPLLARYIDITDGDSAFDIPEVRKAIEAALAGMPSDTAAPLAHQFQEWIEGLDDETLAVRQALVDTANRAIVDSINGELEHRAYDAEQRYEPAKVSDATTLSQPAPEPVERPVAPVVPIRRVEPAPMVLDVGYEDHDRGWHRIHESERP